MVKSVDQIIGYIEGRLSILEDFEPPTLEVKELRNLLRYINGEETTIDIIRKINIHEGDI